MVKKGNKKKNADGSDDSEFLDEDNKDEKRNKNIEKKQKPGKNKEKEQGVKNKERNKSGAPLGRPSEKNKIEVAEDPTASIQESVLVYLDNIGLKHGLVFRKEERAKMNDDRRMTNKWNENHEWDEDKEKEKIDKSEFLQDVMKRFLENINNVLTLEQLTQTFISIGDLTVDECTMEMYRIIAAVLESHLNNENEEQLDKRSKELLEKLYYFSRDFATMHIKYWVEITHNPKENIPGEFLKMMRDMKVKLIGILVKPEKLIKFLKEEQDMSEALKRIIATGERQTVEKSV